MKLYEAMILVDSAIAERDYDGCVSEIDSTIKKYGGNVVDLRKWDDRRLIYEITRVKRALYILLHFECPTSAIESIRRDFVLSERILRHLITIDIDGVPAGDDRPGITSTAIPDFGERRPRDGRPEGGPPEEAEGVPAEEIAKA